MAQQFVINGAPMDLLDVGELALIHDNYRPMDKWLLDRFFPNRPMFDRDEVPLAELDVQHELAPLVAPHKPGKPFDTDRAANVRFVKPAYYKPKNQVTPTNAYDTALFERLQQAGIISTGNARLSDAEKLIIAQVAVMRRNHDAIDNAVLLMARDLLVNGKYTLESDDYENNLVDYGRDAALKYTPTTPWNQAGAKPVSDIKLMGERMINADGGFPRVALMSNAVWAALANNEEFKNEFVKPYAGISVPYNPSLNIQQAATFRGYLDGIELWTYDATYRMNGKVNRFIPKDFFALISDLNGSVAHCRIKNAIANGAVQQYFDRQWYEEDPSGIMLMTESAPLVVPSNKNGVCCGNGFISE